MACVGSSRGCCSPCHSKMSCASHGGEGCCKCLPIRVCVSIVFDDQAEDESFVQQIEVECGIKSYTANFVRNGVNFDLSLTVQASDEEVAAGTCYAALLSDAFGWTFPPEGDDTREHKVLLTAEYDPSDEETLKDSCVNLSATFENVDMGYAGTGTVSFVADRLVCIDNEPDIDPRSEATYCVSEVACIYGINLPDEDDPYETPIPGVQRFRACVDDDYIDSYSGRFDGGGGDTDVTVQVVDDDPTTLSMTSKWGNGDSVVADCPFMQARWDFNGGFEYGGYTIGIVADWRAGCGDCVCWSECLCVQKFNIGDGVAPVQYGEVCWEENASEYVEGGGGAWVGSVSDPDSEFAAETVTITLSCDRCTGITYLTVDGRATVAVNNDFSQCPDIELEIEVPARFGGDTEYFVRVQSKACQTVCPGSLAPECCEDEPDFPTTLVARPSLTPGSAGDCSECLGTMPDEIPLVWTEFPSGSLPPVYAVVGGAPSQRYFAYVSDAFDYCAFPFAESNRLYLAPCIGAESGQYDEDVPWSLIDEVHGVELYDASPCAPVILKFQSMTCASDPADAQIDWDVTEA